MTPFPSAAAAPGPLWSRGMAAVLFAQFFSAFGDNAVLFSALALISVAVYRRWFRGKGRQSDKPLLNRRAEQLVGTVATLDQPIEGGRGRVRIDDAFWTVEGADLPLGTRVRVIAVNGMTLKVQEA